MFDAFTKPELIRRWLLGPPGWTMPVCETDVRVGGAYRYEWKSEVDGSAMAVGGVFLDVVAAERLVATEQFDEAWYPGEARNTTVFEEEDGATKVTITLLYVSKEARNTARASGMERGMAAGYERLDELLPSLLPKEAR